jgi:hypothetical protein
VGWHLLSHSTVAQVHLVKRIGRNCRIDRRNRGLLAFWNYSLPQEKGDPTRRSKELLAIAE